MMLDSQSVSQRRIMFAMHLKLIFALSVLVLQLKEAKSFRIFRGQAAEEFQFPYMVTVKECTGFAINPSTVVTAAHCVVTDLGLGGVLFSGKEILIKYGTIDKDHGIQMKTRKLIVHPDYLTRLIEGRRADDIALLWTEKPFPPIVGHLLLPPQSSEFPLGTNIIMAGWGLTWSDKEPENILRFGNSELVSLKKCQIYEGEYGFPRSLCIGKIVSVTCSGDSGGPMVLKTEEGDTAIGVNSGGREVCYKNEYGDIYLRVSFYTDWIIQNADGDVKINNNITLY